METETKRAAALKKARALGHNTHNREYMRLLINITLRRPKDCRVPLAESEWGLFLDRITPPRPYHAFLEGWTAYCARYGLPVRIDQSLYDHTCRLVDADTGDGNFVLGNRRNTGGDSEG